jgi:hypothetical protein
VYWAGSRRILWVGHQVLQCTAILYCALCGVLWYSSVWLILSKSGKLIESADPPLPPPPLTVTPYLTVTTPHTVTRYSYFYLISSFDGYQHDKLKITFKIFWIREIPLPNPWLSGIVSLVLNPDKLKTQLLSLSLAPAALRVHSTSTYKVRHEGCVCRGGVCGGRGRGNMFVYLFRTLPLFPSVSVSPTLSLPPPSIYLSLIMTPTLLSYPQNTHIPPITLPLSTRCRVCVWVGVQQVAQAVRRSTYTAV